MNATKKLITFWKKLGRDTRGEDLMEKSSALSTGAKVVITAMVVTAASVGATKLANNTNGAGDHTSKQINGAIGAQADTTEKVKSPFSAGAVN